MAEANLAEQAETSASASTAAPKLTGRELNWYALGSLPGGVGALGVTYLVFYYNQVLGLPGSVIGIGAAICSVFDALTDPFAGALSDRTRSRLGRRHPFLLAAAIPSAFTFYLIWDPPSGLSPAWLMIWLLVLHLSKRLIACEWVHPERPVYLCTCNHWEQAALRAAQTN